MSARRIVWGKFLNCGQTCVAPDYVLVHSSVKEELVSAMDRNIRALYGDDPMESKDYGKIINEKHFDRLCGLLEAEPPARTWYTDRNRLKIGPVILEDASWESPAMEDEIFGPILPVITYDRLDEAKSEIEKRPRPLALYMFSRSEQNIRYVTGSLSFGGGCVNDTIMHLAAPGLPFGGVGESGMGSYHGKQSFRTFSHQKSVLRKSLRLDVPLRYPPYGDRPSLAQNVPEIEAGEAGRRGAQRIIMKGCHQNQKNKEIKSPRKPKVQGKQKTKERKKIKGRERPKAAKD